MAADQTEAARQPVDRRKVVTPRPGRASWALIGLAAVVLAIEIVLVPLSADRRRLWDSGAPVLVVVSIVTGEEVMLQEYGGGPVWIAPVDDVPAAEVGARIQARLVGPDRNLMFAPDEMTLPASFRYSWVLLIGFALPGLLARRRWRGLDRVLAGEARRVRLEPVWLRRTLSPPAAVRVRDPGAGRSDAGSDIVVEVKGTPLVWWARSVQEETQGEALVYGPDSFGLMVLETEAGRAVASSSPRSGKRALAVVCSWSDRLAADIGLVEEPADPLSVGGRAHQRISVSGEGGSSAGGQVADQRYTLDLKLVLRWTLWYPLATSGAVLLRFFTSSRSDAALLSALGIGLTALAIARWWAAENLARRAPLSGWTDRAAARQAGRAALALGLRPARPEEVR